MKSGLVPWTIVVLAALGCRPAELAPGSEAVELSAGEKQAWILPLEAGDVVDLSLEQQEIDVELVLLDPAGREVARADAPYGKSAPERLVATAGESGSYHLEARPLDGACGTGRLRLRYLDRRPAGPEDALLAEAFAALTDGDLHRRTGSRDAAEAAYGASLDGFAAAGDGAGIVDAHLRLGLLLRNDGQKERAAEHDRAAVKRAEGHDDPFRLLVAHHALGASLLDLNDVDAAEQALERALRSAERLDARLYRAKILAALAQASLRRGRLQQAIDRAEAGAEQLGDCEAWDRGNARYLSGLLESRPFGRPDRAVEHFSAALADFEQADDPARAATAHNQLGRVHHAAGELEAARGHLERALDLRRSRGDACGTAVSAVNLALLRQDSGRSEDASRSASEALKHLAEGECGAKAATVHLRLGELHLARGAPRKAEEAFLESLRRFGGFEAPKMRLRAIPALTGLAQARRDLGVPAEEVSDVVEQGIAIVEGIRPTLDRRDLRMAFFAASQDLYDLRIELLAEAGDAAGAFDTAEQARARLLRDRLTEVEARLRSAAPADLLDRESGLTSALAEGYWRRLELRTRGQRDPELDARLAELEENLHAVRGERRRAAPAYGELILPRTIDPREVREHLDPDTLLLAVRLGEARSLLWAVDSAGVEAFELPSRAELERTARRARVYLSSPAPPDGPPSDLCRLSRAVLGPAVHRLDRPRLVLVLDGALEEIPFAALPHPDADCKDAPPLVDRHELVHLPSASVLVTLRRRAAAASAPPPAGWIVTVADPVYSAADPRLPADPDRPSPPSGLERLPASGEEARSLLALAPADRRQGFFGTDADLDAVLGALGGFRIAHLAVHAVAEQDRPERSYLALSHFRADGSPRDGLLYAHRLFDLELDAEMVVLSACRTGLGPHMPGEGMVGGLARGFLTAGADRVVASLWDVHDQGTAELMTLFYEHLLRHGDPPARALAEAQNTLRRQGRRPYFWAGFVLVGDWRPMEPFDVSPGA